MKHDKYPYFIFLVDDFNRRRVAFEGGEQQKKQVENTKSGMITDGISSYPPKQWIKENIHTMQVEISNITINAKEMFKYLETSNISKLSQTYKNDQRTQRFSRNNTPVSISTVPTKGGLVLQASIATFGTRICNNFIFKTIYKINGSLELTCHYFEAIVGFIYNIVQTKPNHRGSTICPFQVHLYRISSSKCDVIFIAFRLILVWRLEKQKM